MVRFSLLSGFVLFLFKAWTRNKTDGYMLKLSTFTQNNFWIGDFMVGLSRKLTQLNI